MKRYPYPESRVYLSGVIAGLSIILALTLMLDQPLLMLYYFLSTLAATGVTLLLKRRLYTLLLNDADDEGTREPEDRTPWKILLLTLLMSMAFLIAPLLLTQILSATVWFIMIASFTSGVSLSEIILYFQMRQ